ncbi:MAG: DUF5371 family protein [Archaeoglobaceae archaeon]
MVKLVHAQTTLSEEALSELKRKAGKNATKDAIAVAVEHYLNCQHTYQESLEKKLERTIKKRRVEKERYI